MKTEIIKYVTEPSEFYKILLDEKIDDLNIHFINEDMVEMMRQIIEGQKKRITTVNEKMIFRNSKTKQVENRYHEKDFRLCYDKRVMKKTESGIDTFPYGFKKR